MPPLYKYKKAELIEMVENLQKENEKLKEDIKLKDEIIKLHESGEETIEEIKPEPEIPKITFLFDWIPQDIEDMIIEEKKYMDTKYIRKLLSKRDIRGSIDFELSKYNRKFTNMDKANIDRYFQIIKERMVPNKMFNPRGLSENLYISYLYKDACVKQEEIKKPNEDLKHKWKVGDILFKIWHGQERTVFWRVVKLTKKSYTLEWVENEHFEGNEGYFRNHYTQIDLDNIVAPGRYFKWGEWVEVKKVSNVKESNYYLLEDLIKPDDKNNYLINRIEGRKITRKYWTYDTMN